MLWKLQGVENYEEGKEQKSKGKKVDGGIKEESTREEKNTKKKKASVKPLLRECGYGRIPARRWRYRSPGWSGRPWTPLRLECPSGPVVCGGIVGGHRPCSNTYSPISDGEGRGSVEEGEVDGGGWCRKCIMHREEEKKVRVKGEGHAYETGNREHSASGLGPGRWTHGGSWAAMLGEAFRGVNVQWAGRLKGL